MRRVVSALAAVGALLGSVYEVRAQVQRGVPCDKQASLTLCVRCVTVRGYKGYSGGRADGAQWCAARWREPGSTKRRSQ
jgi:hypothetical protein